MSLNSIYNQIQTIAISHGFDPSMYQDPGSLNPYHPDLSHIGTPGINGDVVTPTDGGSSVGGLLRKEQEIAKQAILKPQQGTNLWKYIFAVILVGMLLIGILGLVLPGATTEIEKNPELLA